MSDLIIDDEYICDTGRSFKTYSEKLQSSFDNYLKILKDIKSQAVISGDISNKLETFIQYAEKLQNEISAIGIELNNSSDTFIEEVDDKDKYLY